MFYVGLFGQSKYKPCTVMFLNFWTPTSFTVNIMKYTLKSSTSLPHEDMKRGAGVEGRGGDRIENCISSNIVCKLKII